MPRKHCIIYLGGTKASCKMEEDVDLCCNSLHPQAQVPDDPLHDQGSQYASRESLYLTPFLHLFFFVDEFQGPPRINTSIPFYFNSCLKATSIYYPAKTDTHTYLRVTIGSIQFSLPRFQYTRARSAHGRIPTVVRGSRD